MRTPDRSPALPATTCALSGMARRAADHVLPFVELRSDKRRLGSCGSRVPRSYVGQLFRFFVGCFVRFRGYKDAAMAAVMLKRFAGWLARARVRATAGEWRRVGSVCSRGLVRARQTYSGTRWWPRACTCKEGCVGMQRCMCIMIMLLVLVLVVARARALHDRCKIGGARSIPRRTCSRA